jgi:hypothetical protein
MVHQSDKYRWLSILAAVFLLVGMVLYAYLKAPEIRSVAYRIEKHQVTTNGSQILNTSGNAFTVKWQHGQPRTFFLQSAPPFNVGDVVAFKLDVKSQPAVLKEYHVRERRSVWYAKLLISVVPLVLVMVFFFRDFRFSREKLVFYRNI